MKTRELGLFWLQDHRDKAQNELKRTRDALKTLSNPDGDYGQQMKTLILAQEAVLAVWIQHVVAAEKA